MVECGPAFMIASVIYASRRFGDDAIAGLGCVSPMCRRHGHPTGGHRRARIWAMGAAGRRRHLVACCR
jgi:hypothetical protein